MTRRRFKPKARKPITRYSPRRDSYYGGSGYPYSGGLVNPLTGTGTSIDKNTYAYFSPTNIYSKQLLEVLYVESWAAAKFIDIPVDDMFIRWREFYEMSEAAKYKLERAEKKFMVKEKLSMAMKSGRLYGSGLFVIITKEAPPDRPLYINRMMPGDLVNIIAVDRFDASVISKNNDITSLNYGKAEMYSINLASHGVIKVHYSRVIRFDGITSLTDTGFQSYSKDWGVPSIVPVMTEIIQDSTTAKGVAHLVNEASVLHQKVEGFEDALSGTGGEMTLQERMAEVSALRSIYRTVFMDSEDDAFRLDINFSQLPEIMDRNANRLAAAARIVSTRFWGKSAVGMNATGEGDERDYAKQVASDQENKLPGPLKVIDAVLSRHTGVNEPIQYFFPSILDLSDEDKARVLLIKSQALVPLQAAGNILENEVRAALDGDEILGNLAQFENDMPGVEEFMKAAAAEKVNTALEQAQNAKAT